MSVYQAGGVLFLLLAFVATGVVGLLLYEAWTLLTSRAPITWFARLGIHDHSRISYVIGIAIGILLGHLFWS